MRRAFFVLMVLLLAINASALEWDVPESIPESVNWSIYADLGGVDYDRLQVFLEGDRVYETSWGGTDIDYSKIVSVEYDASGKDLAVSLRGLREGNYDIELKLLKEGNEQDSRNETVEVFVPGSITLINETESEMNSIRQSMNALEGRISNYDELNNSIISLQSNLSELEGELEREGNENDSLSGAIETLKNELEGYSDRLSRYSSKMQSTDENQQAAIVQLEAEVDSHQTTLTKLTAESETPLAGFASFISGNPMISVALLVVVIIAILVFIVRKRGITTETLFETDTTYATGTSPDAEDIDLGHSDSDSSGTANNGKWAFGEEDQSEEAKESKGFSFRDLLWKK